MNRGNATGTSRLRLTAVFGGVALLLSGCAGPGRDGSPSRPLHETPSLTSSKLSQIDAISFSELSTSDPLTVEQASTNAAQRVDLSAAVLADGELLSLEEVRAATLANNLGLKAELIDGAIADTRVDEERAKFDAVFRAGASYDKADLLDADSRAQSVDYYAGLQKTLPTGGALSVQISGGQNEGYTGTDSFPLRSDLSFRQPLLQGAGVAQNLRSIRIAELENGIVSGRMKQRVIQLLVRADTAYWNLYAAVKELEVRREQYQLAQDQLKHAQRRVDSGAAARIEMVRAEAGVASRLESVINAENRVERSNRNLLQIMGVSILQHDGRAHVIPKTDPYPLSLKLDRRELVRFALENRMECVQLELQMAVNQLNLEQAQNNTLPDLSLSGGLGVESERDHVSDSSAEAYVGLALSVPLGNRAAKLQLERTKLYQQISRAEEEELQQMIQQQVLDAVSALESSWRRILAAEQGVQAAERDYRVEQSQFQLGVRTSTDVLQAATRLSDAQLARIRAFADYEIAQISLATATGTTLGRNHIIIDQLLSAR